MKISHIVSVLLIVLLFQIPLQAQKTIVEKYGQLSVKGKYIIGQYGDTVQLRGMSYFWSQWQGAYYNAGVVKWLKDDWKCTVIRAAMGVDHGGYADQPYDQLERVKLVVKAAIDAGIYVVIDYHSHQAHMDPYTAKKFFSEMAKKYGSYPNVLYEIYNEPLQETSWSDDIKPYADTVIKAIREYDPDNIVIVGTRQWSQLVHEASLDKISDPNTAYTLHFYAATHKDWLREEAQKALDNGICIFVTEYGTCEASGNGVLDYEETKKWWDFMDQNKISYCNWSISDKEETASILIFGASWTGKWKESKLTPSGLFVREDMIKKNTPIFGTLKTE
ncbi:MAG: glycoside hydrolase family 5 protein [Cytophagaceae bacterium]|nr:glycoside hydrolase family 5 protein [Cytophagaceae bacterium]